MTNTAVTEHARHLASRARHSRRILATEIRDSRRFFRTNPEVAARGFARLAQNAGHTATPKTQPNTLIRLALEERLNKAKALTPKAITKKAEELESEVIMMIGAAAVSTCRRTRAEKMREAELQELEARVFRTASTILAS